MQDLTRWRIDGYGPAAPIDHDKLVAGLARHLAHAPVWLLLAQIGTEQQSYVSLSGCAGCARAQCAPGCYVALLHRLLRAAAPQLRLHAVQRGLAPRPYSELVYARPGPDADPLDGRLLHPWPDARLILHWQPRRRGPAVAALLAVGGASDSALAALALRG